MVEPGWTRQRSRAESRAEDNTILLAVPKKGRCHEAVMKLLEGSGLEATRPDRLDVAQCKNLPVKLVFLPSADIPMYVMDGNCDVGITGMDMLEELLVSLGMGFREGDSKPPLKIVSELGFGKCKLCLQAPIEKCDLGPDAFCGKRIVTSFPALAKRYFDDLAKQRKEPVPETRIKVVSGSCEAACGLGLADAIVDLVETGTTMKAAGLDIVTPIFETQTILIQQLPNKENGLGGAKGELLDLIIKRIKGYLTATRHVLLAFNCQKR
jgi:ATP phosphoribosyltransferase